VKSVGLWIAALVALAAGSAGVTQHSTPFATPVVEKPTDGDAGTFDGLLDLAEASPSSIVKVLWTHGMCTHPPSWVDDRVKRLVAAVGGTAETKSLRAVGSRGASMRTERISTRGKTIEVMFLTWSPLTASYKAVLAYDVSATEGGKDQYARATLNRELKRGLVNDCLTDVVVYGGPNGNDIRQAMNEAVCDALGGLFDGKNCNVLAGNWPAALALVTESLGSKLLFDAVLHIWNAAENSSDETAIDRLANSLAATRMMYMLSNQVPLLDVAGSVAIDKTLEAASVPPRMQTSAGDVFSLLARARSLAPLVSAPMTVVAFSDPNDLLSYRIVPAHLAEDLKEFRVINVLVSNDATYFGYLERPDTAHCGYPWNPHVFGMLARGYRAGKSLHSVSGLLGGSCANYLWLAAPEAEK
jgi:hypothetical protein